MLSITLLPQEEYQWREENPSSKTFPQEKGRYPLYHQWRTYNADAPIIVNTYNTGTGKTLAAFLRLLKRVEQKGREILSATEDNVLLVAPTNELIRQHVEDAKKFCENNRLPYRVQPVTREMLERVKARPGVSEGPLRRSALLHYLLNDGSIADDDWEKYVTIYVVNPDIFYYALYFCYNAFDRSPLFSDFVSSFNYIVIDELHYYDPKQLAVFLFFMKLSEHSGYIDSVSKHRQFCILTATPRPQVTTYLERLGVPVAWIKPGDIAPEDLPYVQPMRALAQIQLQVYSTDELQNDENVGGLLQLISQQQNTIRAWLDATNCDPPMDGAIISSSLGTISRIHQVLLKTITSVEMGRITGAEKRGSREEARDKRLILATPTVDLGYNFDRTQSKPRQNIDFLLLDAYSGDELVQRIGRAGRVLTKEQKGHASIVMAVVDPLSYQHLKEYDGGKLERTRLSQIAEEHMPRKNDLYAYIRTGAIAEAFRPIVFMGQGTELSDMPDLNTFLADLQKLFGRKEEKLFTYDDVRKIVYAFERRHNQYGKLRSVPQEVVDLLPLIAQGRIPEMPTWNMSDSKECFQVFQQRTLEVRKKGLSWKGIVAWLHKDLRQYFKEKARFSFRDSFQPPLALVHDPDHLHSNSEVNTYNALHFIKYYHAHYGTREQWEHVTGKQLDPVDLARVSVYCRLSSLRDQPLRIGLELGATDFTREAWEEDFAYQVTALYGMKIVAMGNSYGLTSEEQSLLQSQFIPAFVALDESSTGGEIRRLRKVARFYPIPLKVTFYNGPRNYHVILGSMAFQICAELPHWKILLDRRKTQLEDDAPIIC